DDSPSRVRRGDKTCAARRDGEPGAARSPPYVRQAGAQGPGPTGADSTQLGARERDHHRAIPRCETGFNRCAVRPAGDQDGGLGTQAKVLSDWELLYLTTAGARNA